MLGPTTQDLIYLLPFAFPLLGIVALMAGASRVSPRLRNLFAAGSALASLVAILALWRDAAWSVSLAAPSVAGMPGEPAAVIRYAPGPWSLLLGVTLTATAILVSVTTLGHPVARGSLGIGLVALVAGLSTCVSGTLLTTAVGWGLLDLAVLAFNSWHAFGRGDMAGVSWRAALAYLGGIGIWGVVLLSPPSGQTGLTATSRMILAGAALVRLGVYPLPFATLHSKRLPPASTVIVQVVSVAFGVQLLAGLAPKGLPLGNIMVPLMTAALLITALIAWEAEDHHRAMSYVLVNQSVTLVLSMYLAPHDGVRLSILWLANLALSLCCVASDTRYVLGGAGLGDLAVPFIALASLSGVPPTPGFAVKWNLLGEALAQGSRSMAAISVIASALIVPPLLRRAHLLWEQPKDMGDIPAWASRAIQGALWVAGAIILVMGLYPGILGQLAGRGSPSWPGLPWTPPEGVSLLSMNIMTVVLPLAGGYLLHRARLLSPLRSNDVTAIIAQVLDLGWVRVALQWMVDKLKSIVRAAARFTEQGLYLGWTLMWTLLLLFWLFGEV